MSAATHYTTSEDAILNLLCLLQEALNPKVRHHPDPAQITEQVRLSQAASLVAIDEYVRSTWPTAAEQVPKIEPYQPTTNPTT